MNPSASDGGLACPGNAWRTATSSPLKIYPVVWTFITGHVPAEARFFHSLSISVSGDVELTYLGPPIHSWSRRPAFSGTGLGALETASKQLLIWVSLAPKTARISHGSFYNPLYYSRCPNSLSSIFNPQTIYTPCSSCSSRPFWALWASLRGKTSVVQAVGWLAAGLCLLDSLRALE